MWWLIPIAVLGIYSYFTSEKTKKEKQSFERWEKRKKIQLEKIERLKIVIENNIKQEKLNNDFITLTELHFNSFLVSNETYKLLDDAKIVLDYFNKIIKKTKEHVDDLYARKKKSSNLSINEEFDKEIEIILDQIISFKKDNELCASQKKNLFEELKKLNIQTSLLKYIIRDKCGPKGIDWFERLEKRKQKK